MNCGKQKIELRITIKEMPETVKPVKPSRSVELRNPYYGAVQCVGGNIHRHGTLPNLVEMNAEIFMSLIYNPHLRETLNETGNIKTSGSSFDLSEVFLRIGKILISRKEVNKE
jgi:hypothetical protein